MPHHLLAAMSSTMLAAMSDATSVFMSSMVEHVALSVMKIILFVTFIFIIENGLGLGFGDPGTFYDAFKTSWIKQFVTKL